PQQWSIDRRELDEPGVPERQHHHRNRISDVLCGHADRGDERHGDETGPHDSRLRLETRTRPSAYEQETDGNHQRHPSEAAYDAELRQLVAIPALGIVSGREATLDQE